MRHHIVLASNNAGKVREFNQLLQGHKLEVLPQSEFSVTEIEETGLTFVENALLKARNAAAHTGLPAIADDSVWKSTPYTAPRAFTPRVMPVAAPATGRTWKSFYKISKASPMHSAQRAFNA